MRISGVGSQYSGLPEASGVETVIELAQRNAQNLYEKMAEVTGAARLVCVLPSPDKVTDWVAQAATMPRVVAPLILPPAVAGGVRSSPRCGRTVRSARNECSRPFC